MGSSQRETVDVETAGATVLLEKPHDDTVNVRVAADGSIDLDLKVSDRDGSYFTHKSYSATADVDDTGLKLTERFVEVEVTAGTGTANDTADIFLSSGGADV